jgi:hypothetical protein
MNQRAWMLTVPVLVLGTAVLCGAEEEAASAAAIDTGDTTWMLVSSVLVLTNKLRRNNYDPEGSN